MGHFFTRFPKGVVNPFIYSLPEGFTIERKWWGQDGDHWSTTHDVRYEGTNVNKRIQLVGSGFAPGSLMMWDGNKDKGAWIVKRWTSTSENPTPRCPTLTWSSSGPRPGPPSLTTGTSMRERRLRNPPTTKLLRRRGA